MHNIHHSKVTTNVIINNSIKNNTVNTNLQNMFLKKVCQFVEPLLLILYIIIHNIITILIINYHYNNIMHIYII